MVLTAPDVSFVPPAMEKHSTIEEQWVKATKEGGAPGVVPSVKFLLPLIPMLFDANGCNSVFVRQSCMGE